MKIFDWLFSKAINFLLGTEGQQRIRAMIIAAVLSVAAKWKLPPEVADYAANTIAGAGLTLVLSWTARKPGAPAMIPGGLLPPPPLPDGLPGDPPTVVE